MFNILEFIDSKDIREYNKNTAFTPLEQAVIIYYSLLTTVEEKISAWRELLSAYEEEDFKQLNYGERQFSDCPNRQLVSNTLCAYENTLSYQRNSRDVVFAANLNEVGYPRPDRLTYFSTYRAAFDDLIKEKQKYLDDEDLKDIPTKAQISIFHLNDPDSSEEARFDFDNDMRMVQLIPFRMPYGCEKSCRYSYDFYDLDAVFIRVPIPFRKGDILRTVSDAYLGEKQYAVLPCEITHDDFIKGNPNAIRDGSDMAIVLESYEEKEDWGFDYNHYNYLYWEKCPPSEVPENKRMLILLNWVYKEKMTAGTLLHLYGRYGGQAYREIAPAYLEQEVE